MGLLCLVLIPSFGQNQKLSDSLIQVYESGGFEGEEIHLLERIALEETKPNVKVEYAERLIQKASADSLFYYIYQGYLQKGNALQFLGNSAEALKSFYTSMKYAEKVKNPIYIGSLSISIADSYSAIGNSQSAAEYYRKGIQLLRKENDSVKIATALLNAGDEFINLNKLDSARLLTDEARLIFGNLHYSIGEAYSLGNLGMIHARQGKDSLALANIIGAIDILEELEDYYPISVYLTYISDIYASKQDWKQAFAFAEKSLEMALKYGLKEQISNAYLQLSELYEQQGMNEESLANYKKYIQYRDSVTNIAAVQEMANLRTNYEVSQKQVEVDLLNEQKRNQRIVVIATAIALFLIGILAVGLYRRNKFISRTKEIIEKEKRRSDDLLLNILPEETAAELKSKGKVQPKRFESVSVMFTDFKGFTAYSDKLSPEELVDSIDFYYSNFDKIIEKHGLEKIKTVGDAYMCAAGLPYPSPDHAVKIVEAALEISEFVKESKKNDPDDMTRFDIRIGVNSGPVVAGVVGTKKFVYDIWGDTVNIASRMESNSEPGRINISEETYRLVKDHYSCSYRGELEAKNKGLMKMYFVEHKNNI